MAERDEQLATVTRTGPAHDQAPAVEDERDVSLKDRDPRRYEFIEEHGRGGLGRVMRTRDLDLGREVAIKEILDPSGIDEVRFVREALITARLEHPGIVPVHDAGRWPNGTPFYAMKLVSGRPLKDLLNETTVFDDRLGYLANLLAVSEAIAYAHDRGVVHRDLKPSNIMVGRFGETVVIDWGLAKDLTAAEPPILNEGPYRTPLADGGLTAEGSILGTPAYMSPEQAAGTPVGKTSDVYSIGAILYHLLAGTPPFPGQSTADVLHQLLTSAPRQLQELQPRAPADLCAIVRKSMMRDPHDRYADASDLARDLRRYTTGQLVSAHRYSSIEVLLRWIRRYRAAVSVALIAIALLVSFGLVAFRRIARSVALAEARTLDVRKAEEALAAKEQKAALNDVRRLMVEDPAKALARLQAQLSALPAAALLELATEAARAGLPRWVFPSYGTANVAFSPDGSLVGFADRHQVGLLDSNTGHLRRSWALPLAPDSSTNLLAWVDGTHLVVSRDTGLSAVVEPSGRMTFLRTRPRETLEAVLQPRGQRMALMYEGGEVDQIDVGSQAHLPTVVVPDASVLAYGVDGTLAIATKTRLVALTRVDGKHLEFPLGCRGVPTSLALATRKAMLFVGTSEGELVIFSLKLGHATSIKRILTSSISVLSLDIAEDIVSASSNDGTTLSVRLADGSSSTLARSWINRISEDGSWLGTCSQVGTVTMHHLASGWSRTITTGTEDVVDLALSSTGDMVSASEDHTIRLWPQRLRPTFIHNRDSAFLYIQKSSRGGFIASSEDGVVSTWNNRGVHLATRRMCPSLTVVGSAGHNNYSICLANGELDLLDGSLSTYASVMVPTPVTAVDSREDSLVVSSSRSVTLIDGRTGRLDRASAFPDLGDDRLVRIQLQSNGHVVGGSEFGALIDLDLDSGHVVHLGASRGSRISGLVLLDDSLAAVQWRSGDTSLVQLGGGVERSLRHCDAQFFQPSVLQGVVAFPCGENVLLSTPAGVTTSLDFGATIRDVDTAGSLLVARAKDDALHLWDKDANAIGVLPANMAVRDVALSFDASTAAAAGASQIQFWDMSISSDRVPQEHSALIKWLALRTSAFQFAKGN